jgi:inositol-phosphate phosphatase/L-galactose 1-phosphate phosphatase/histidinol-phosphatase
MNDAELSEISEFIYFLADNAKQITMSGFKSSLTTKRKKDGSPVTKFDINAEKVIVDLISDKYPTHNIIAEENGSKNSDSDYTWIIDPIDGTRSYIVGRPLWSTLIGFAFKGNPIVGLADFPALDERWLGYKSNCYFNKLEFLSQKASLKNLSEATIGSTDPNLFSSEGKKKYEQLLKKTKSHIWSGDSHNYLLVMNGGLDLVVEEGLHSYDIIPLIPILKSQNIIITDWIGNELSLKLGDKATFSTLVSNNKHIYQTALSILK